MLFFCFHTNLLITRVRFPFKLNFLYLFLVESNTEWDQDSSGCRVCVRQSSDVPHHTRYNEEIQQQGTSGMEHIPVLSEGKITMMLSHTQSIVNLLVHICPMFIAC